MPEADKAGERYQADRPQAAPGFFLKGSHQLDWGMKNRLARVFNPASGRTVMLAVDHGYFQGPTSVLERIDLSIVPLLPQCDALFCTRGILRSLIPADTQYHRLLRVSWDERAQNAAGAEQRVALRQQRYDREVDALQARRRPLEVAVVDGEHHRAPRCRIEHAGEPVLHAPVELVRAFQEKSRRGLWAVGLIAFACFICFRHGLSPSRSIGKAACAHCFGAAGAVSAGGLVISFFAAGFLAATAGPRLSFRLDLQLAMKAVRLAPSSFWSSVPNLQVSIFCALVSAEAGLASSRRGSRPMMAMVRSMVISPLTGLDPESR